MNLAELRAEPAFCSLVCQFIEDLPSRLQGIQEAAKQGDDDAVIQLAHQLAGAGGGFGFPELGLAAGKVERCANGVESREHLLDAIDALSEEIDAATVRWDEEVVAV